MSGVSISENHNIDLEAIIAGGPAFEQRLKWFREVSDSALESKAFAEKMMKEASATKADADLQLAANKTAAEELAAAKALAIAAEAKSNKLYEELLAICAA